jgi:RNA polymerase sigma-70 factor (ECF subfamily)
VAQGDPSAFRALFDLHWARVWRLAYGVLLDAAEAEDVTQEVFVKLLASAAHWRPDAGLGTWLHRVTVNAALSLRRRMWRWLWQPPDDLRADSCPEGALARAQAHVQLRRAVGKLTPHQRAVVMLALDADLEPREIGPLLGRNAGWARVTLHRALERLQGAELDADLLEAFRASQEGPC